jgi:NADPH2:quinone reductase
MRALIAAERPAAPSVGRFAEPAATDKLAVCAVKAAALTNLDVAVAEGRHYFSSGRWPQIIGREAVAVTPSGERVFLTATAIPSPYGSMAERCLADLACALPVPSEISDEIAAAVGNAGLAGWLSLSWRAGLKKGEAVLILGATGTSGRIAAAAAQLLGAGRVIVAGRNSDMLAQLCARGAHACVQLGNQDDLSDAFRSVAPDGVDVVIDFLNGAPAEAALGVMRVGGRMVQIGSALAPGIMLNAQVARRNCLDVRGFAYYHAPIADQRDAYRRLCQSALSGEVEIDYRSISLEEAAIAWSSQKQGGRERWVVQP